MQSFQAADKVVIRADLCLDAAFESLYDTTLDGDGEAPVLWGKVYGQDGG